MSGSPKASRYRYETIVLFLRHLSPDLPLGCKQDSLVWSPYNLHGITVGMGGGLPGL